MSGSEKTGGNFEALLGELGEDLNKAIPADGDTAAADAKIDAAAAEGEGDGDEKDEGEGEAVAKSFTLKLEDGTEIDAVDGEELIKSLIGRIEKNEEGVGGLLKAQTAAIVGLGDMVKSLRAEVTELKGQGRGRKAVITVSEKPAPKAEEMAKSEPQGLSGEEFMAKALSAQAAGRINGTQVAIAEAHINAGKAPPADIVRTVLGE